MEAPDDEARREEHRQDDMRAMAENLAFIERNPHVVSSPTWNPSWKR